MTNEDLAYLAKNGNDSALAELWKQVERFVRCIGLRWCRAYGERLAFELDDFVQSGYLTFIDAVHKYDPLQDVKFVTFLGKRLDWGYAAMTGRARSGKRVLSLDAPKSTADDAIDLVESIPDENAADPSEDRTRSLYLEELHAAFEKAFGRLPQRQSDIIRRRHLDDRSLKDIADEDGQSYSSTAAQYQRGMMKLSNMSSLQAFTDERTNWYLYVGSESFQNTGTSAVERLVMRREQLREEWTGCSASWTISNKT